MTSIHVDETVQPTISGLFLAFLKIGLLGFGGVAAWARHVLVVERRFLTAKEFAESFGLASSLPGANTVNLATMLGDRFFGARGAACAVLGLMGAPVFVLVATAVLYSKFGALADVKAALFGAAAAAAGVVLGTSIKILRDLEPDLVAIVTTAAVGIAAGVKVPIVAIITIGAPLSVAAKLVGRPRA